MCDLVITVSDAYLYMITLSVCLSLWECNAIVTTSSIILHVSNVNYNC